MRILLLLILTFFQLLVPVRSNAGQVSQTDVSHFISQKDPAPAITDHRFSGALVADQNHLYQQKTNLSQFRYLPFVKYFNNIPVSSDCEAVISNKFFVQPYLHCKPIGLKLLFPEHYFW